MQLTTKIPPNNPKKGPHIFKSNSGKTETSLHINSIPRVKSNHEDITTWLKR